MADRTYAHVTHMCACTCDDVHVCIMNVHVAAEAGRDRESPENDPSAGGRTGVSRGDLTVGVVHSKRQIDLRDRPCALYPRWRGPPRLPGGPEGTHSGATPAVNHSSAPRSLPQSPYPHSPSVRLPRTMPCYGTTRVRVLECPPLGRPSLIKLVRVKKTVTALSTK